MASTQRKSQQSKAPVPSSDSESEAPSQEAEVNIMKAAHSMVESNKSRRDLKRKAIEADHEKRVKETKGKMEKLFDARKSKVTKSQKAVWERLDALNRKRQSLESLILSSMKKVEIHSTNISSELNAMFEGRIEDIERHSSQRA